MNPEKLKEANELASEIKDLKEHRDAIMAAKEFKKIPVIEAYNATPKGHTYPKRYPRLALRTPYINPEELLEIYLIRLNIRLGDLQEKFEKL